MTALYPASAASPSTVTLQERLRTDRHQLSRQQTETPPPTIAVAVSVAELSVQSDQAALQRAQLQAAVPAASAPASETVTTSAWEPGTASATASAAPTIDRYL